MAVVVARWLPGPFPAGAVLADGIGGAVVAVVVPGSPIARMEPPAVAVGDRVVAIGTGANTADITRLSGAAAAAAIRRAMGPAGVCLWVRPAVAIGGDAVYATRGAAPP